MTITDDRDIAPSADFRRGLIDERLRIARDLHDGVAHHVAVVNVQASLARHLLNEQPLAAADALEHVRRASAAILDELGDILRVLRDSGGPIEETERVPGLRRLADLIGMYTAAGMPVDWSTTGQPRRLPGAVDLVAYRVVQEALTNAEKHGSGTAEVRVRYTGAAVELEVTNPVPVRPRSRLGSRCGGTGYGLIGMRERVAAVGGRLSAGPRANGYFQVTAVLPVVSAS